MQPDQQRLEQLALRCLHPIDGKLNPVELSVAIVGCPRPGLVGLGLLADDGEQVGDLLTVLDVDLLDVLLEARERRARADLLPDAATSATG